MQHFPSRDNSWITAWNLSSCTDKTSDTEDYPRRQTRNLNAINLSCHHNNCAAKDGRDKSFLIRFLFATYWLLINWVDDKSEKLSLPVLNKWLCSSGDSPAIDPENFHLSAAQKFKWLNRRTFVSSWVRGNLNKLFIDFESSCNFLSFCLPFFVLSSSSVWTESSHAVIFKASRKASRKK